MLLIYRGIALQQDLRALHPEGKLAIVDFDASSVGATVGASVGASR